MFVEEDEVGCWSIKGIMARCTPVGVLNPNLRHAWTRGADNPKSENVVVNADELLWYSDVLLLLRVLSWSFVVSEEEEERFFLDDA